MECNPPGSSVHGMFQARILEWVAFPGLSSQLGDQILVSCIAGRFLTIWVTLLSHFSCVRLCATPETAAHQAPPSLGFSRQKHWSGLPFPSPGDLPNPGIEPWSPALQADSLPSETAGKSGNRDNHVIISYLFYTWYQECICVNPNLPIPITHSLPPWYPYICPVSLFLLCK